jgi:hypothetical protein
MKTIYKYTAPITDLITLELPLGSKILSIQNQKEQFTFWVEVELDEKEVLEHHFVVYGTGHPINDHAVQLKYLATVQFNAGMLVFHVYGILSNDRALIDTIKGERRENE